MLVLTRKLKKDIKNARNNLKKCKTQMALLS